MPTILFRKDFNSEEEFKIASKYFNVVERRSSCPENDLIIGRYSVLPYYRELCDDLKSINSRLINSIDEYTWIANFDYYYDLKEFTPETWDDSNFYTCQYDGPFVVKGKTNSKKQKWDKLMFAQTKRDAVKLASVLMDDMAIVEQGVVYRKYVPLKTFEIGLHGLPFSNEWRFFFYKENLLTYSFYWTNCEQADKASIDEAGLEFVHKIANIAAQHTNFFVLDIAEKEEGGWILIEINDGQMSGLSDCNPDELYKNLLNNV